MDKVFSNINSMIYFPFSPGKDNLAQYSYDLSKHLHEGEERQNGQSYFEAHSVPIVERFKRLGFHKSLHDVLSSIGYLHDAIENNLEVKILSPFDSRHKPDSKTLNILFRPAGSSGTKVLYGVRRLTDTYKNKFEYINSLINISPSMPWQNLDVGILALKACDLWENNRSPIERYRKKNDSAEEETKYIRFLAKKLRRGMELKYHYLNRIENTLLSYKENKIAGGPLFDPKQIKGLTDEIRSCVDEFIRLNPPMEIVLSNEGIGDIDKSKLQFYTKAFQKLSEDMPKAFNYFRPKPLPVYMHLSRV